MPWWATSKKKKKPEREGGEEAANQCFGQQLFIRRKSQREMEKPTN